MTLLLSCGRSIRLTMGRLLRSVRRPVRIDLDVRLAGLHVYTADAAEGHGLRHFRVRNHLDMAAAVRALPDTRHRLHLAIAHVAGQAFTALLTALVHCFDQFLLSGDSSEREDGL